MGDFVVNFFESLGYVYFVSQWINRNEKYKLLHSYFLFIASLVILTVSSYLTHIDYSLVIAPVVADLCTTPVALSAPPNSYQNNSQS